MTVAGTDGGDHLENIVCAMKFMIRHVAMVSKFAAISATRSSKRLTFGLINRCKYVWFGELGCEVENLVI